MGVPWDGRTEMERLAKRIKELEDQQRAQAAQGTHLPFVDADPNVAYGNIWMMNDNRIRIRKPDGTIREIITTAPAGSTTGVALPAVPAQPRSHLDVWTAAWSQTYRGNGAQRPEDALHVGAPGSGDSYNGNQTALIGWPYATIVTALSGATITSVEIFLYATHCYWNGGSTMSVASQINTAAPGSLSGINTGAINNVHVKGSDQGGESDAARWKRVSNQFGARLRDGTSRGVALIAPSTNPSYYSILGGVNAGPAPKIRIGYVK